MAESSDFMDMLDSEMDEIMNMIMDEYEECKEAEVHTSMQVSTVQDWLLSELQNVTPAFSFHQAAKTFEKSSENVSKVSSLLLHEFEKCLSRDSKISGVNRERTMANYYKAAFGGLLEVNTITKDHKLTQWLALQVFRKFVDHHSSNHGNCETKVICAMTEEEKDISHYIGGCIVKKLTRKQTVSNDILSTFTDTSCPEPNTLLHAKSRGKLTNITTEARAMFEEMEQVFRDTFPDLTSKSTNEKDYHHACLKNKIIQTCFFNITYNSDSDEAPKERVFTELIHLYFKIRVHHRCKIILDRVRAKTRRSSKDRSFRAKLSQ